MGQAAIRRRNGTMPTGPKPMSVIKTTPATMHTSCAVQERLVGEVLGPDVTETIARACRAVRDTAGATSEILGADCLLHARLLAGLLQRNGIAAKAVGGFAAWRVGDGEGDMVYHGPMLPAGGFHYWVQLDGGVNVDATTYQIPAKLREMDAIDGRRTLMTWRRDHLVWIGLLTSDPARTIAQAHRAGAFGYCVTTEHTKLAQSEAVDASLLASAHIAMRGGTVIGLMTGINP